MLVNKTYCNINSISHWCLPLIGLWWPDHTSLGSSTLKCAVRIRISHWGSAEAVLRRRQWLQLKDDLVSTLYTPGRYWHSTCINMALFPRAKHPLSWDPRCCHTNLPSIVVVKAVARLAHNLPQTTYRSLWWQHGWCPDRRGLMSFSVFTEGKLSFWIQSSHLITV